MELPLVKLLLNSISRTNAFNAQRFVFVVGQFIARFYPTTCCRNDLRIATSYRCVNLNISNTA